jgi:hypothetical protein
MAKDLSAGLTAAAGRKFGGTVGSAFVFLAAIALWRQHPSSARVLGALGAVLIVSALLVPTALGPVERAWMAMAHAISRVTNPIAIGLVFFGVMTPLGLARRAFGGRGLPRHTHGASAWRVRTEGRRRGDLTRQF